MASIRRGFKIIDPETGLEYRFDVTNNEKDVEIEVFRKGSVDPVGRVTVEVWDGKCQAILSSERELFDNGGDDPTVIILCREGEK